MLERPDDIRAPYGDIYANSKFVVTDNGSGELIVRLKNIFGVSIRITAHSNNTISVVTQDSKFELYYINGLHGVVTQEKEK